MTDTASQEGNIRPDTDAGDSSLGRRLRQEREETGLSQTEAAKLVGISRVSLNRYENDNQRAPYDVVAKLRHLYLERTSGLPSIGNVPRGTMAVSETPPSEDDEESWSPNPALKNKIPKRAYEVAIAYCRRLQSGGWPKDEIEQIERLMVDPRYAQANKRKGHELSVDDHIMLIDATWEAVKHTAAALGRQV